MRDVGKTPNWFKFITISSHTLKNIQQGIAEIIFKDRVQNRNTMTEELNILDKHIN